MMWEKRKNTDSRCVETLIVGKLVDSQAALHPSQDMDSRAALHPSQAVDSRAAPHPSQAMDSRAALHQAKPNSFRIHEIQSVVDPFISGEKIKKSITPIL